MKFWPGPWHMRGLLPDGNTWDTHLGQRNDPAAKKEAWESMMYLWSGQ